MTDKLEANWDTWDYGSREPLFLPLSEFTEREKDLLIKSNTFCMLPWIHIHGYPDGKAYPCCLADYNHPVGSLKENTMEEVWRDKPMQQMRENMLADKPCVECTKCYEQEKTGFFSMRNSSNQTFGHHIKETLTSDKLKIRYYDIRFSNLCNFSCRSCGDIFSSNWTKEYKEYGWLPKDHPNVTYAGRFKTDIWEQTLPHVPYFQEVYFAGGEPLMMQEHWDLLDELIKQGRTDVKLVYNTNFSETVFKGRDVFEIWKEFDEVSVGASLDASYARGELMRKGTKWNQTVANRERMLEVCPDVDFYISSTLSIMNSYHIPDFHKEWIELGLLKPMDWNINILQSPEYYRIDV
jgi:radical SAM protein with 4Fe4S-binding SPASM domain